MGEDMQVMTILSVDRIVIPAFPASPSPCPGTRLGSRPECLSALFTDLFLSPGRQGVPLEVTRMMEGSLYQLQLSHYPKVNDSVSFYHNHRFILLPGSESFFERRLSQNKLPGLRVRALQTQV